MEEPPLIGARARAFGDRGGAADGSENSLAVPLHVHRAIDRPEGFCRRDIGWRALKR